MLIDLFHAFFVIGNQLMGKEGFCWPVCPGRISARSVTIVLVHNIQIGKERVLKSWLQARSKFRWKWKKILGLLMATA